jgi:guanosine-3',5'-bis(diphosphate) 3'-pyrophosphohydrolase
MTTPLLAKAITFAQEKHEGQKRKATGLPYITHLAGVALLVKLFKRSKNLEALVCAAYLHDILEDTDTSLKELEDDFGPMVASLVGELTSDKEEIAKVGKTKYLEFKMLKMSNYALTLKLCDRLHNVSDGPTQKTLKETRDIVRSLTANRDLTNSQQKIVGYIWDRLMNIVD